MAQVSLTGWKIGLKKIALALLIKERAALSLSVAKSKVDCLLNDEVVVLDFQDAQQAHHFLDDALALGALGTIVAE